jgi:hypothetical protein
MPTRSPEAGSRSGNPFRARPQIITHHRTREELRIFEMEPEHVRRSLDKDFLINAGDAGVTKNGQMLCHGLPRSAKMVRDL